MLMSHCGMNGRRDGQAMATDRNLPAEILDVLADRIA